MTLIDSQLTNGENSSVIGLLGRLRLQKHTLSNINTESTTSNFNSVKSLKMLTLKSNFTKSISENANTKENLTYDTRSYKKNWMEIERSHLQAYEYLCHLSEAKFWLETCLMEDIGPLENLGHSLQNGIYLAKLARQFQPDIVKKIFKGEKLQFRHSDNINAFLEAIKKIGLPQIFLFELTDLYSRKSIPKVIYCIHALSHLLSKKGLAPSIQDLVGYLDFTDDQLVSTKKELDITGFTFPAFLNVGSDLNRAMEGTASIRIIDSSKRSRKGFSTSRSASSSSSKHSLKKSITKQMIKMVPSHVATLTTNSAINMIKNGFTEVTFKPELSISPLEQHFNPITETKLSPISTIKMDSTGSNSVPRSHQLSRVVYSNQSGEADLSSPKLATASFRVSKKKSISRRKMNHLKPIDEPKSASQPAKKTFNYFTNRMKLASLTDSRISSVKSTSLKSTPIQSISTQNISENPSQVSDLNLNQKENRTLLPELTNYLMNRSKSVSRISSIPSLSSSATTSNSHYDRLSKSLNLKSSNITNLSTATTSPENSPHPDNIPKLIDLPIPSADLKLKFGVRSSYKDSSSQTSDNNLEKLFQKPNDRELDSKLSNIAQTEDKSSNWVYKDKNKLETIEKARFSMDRIENVSNDSDFKQLIQDSIDERQQLRSVSYEDYDDTDGSYQFIWANYEPFVIMAQSYVRGVQQRKRYRQLRKKLHLQLPKIETLQALARGCIARIYTEVPILNFRSGIEQLDLSVLVQFQALSRRFLATQSFVPMLLEARAQADGFFDHLHRFQALSRRVLVQRKWTNALDELHRCEYQVTQMQAMVRGLFTRQYFIETLTEIYDQEQFAPPDTEIEPNYPTGYHQVESILKFQANYWNGRQLPTPQPRQASESNPLPPIPVSRVSSARTMVSKVEPEASQVTIQDFMQLLDDSGNDFSQELKLEALRQEAIHKFRIIYDKEQTLNQLDIKIALLVRNRITLEEVLKLTRSTNLDKVNNGSPLTNRLSSLKNLDKESRKRLEGYQQLFYLLQTQPQYLAKLLSVINRTGPTTPHHPNGTTPALVGSECKKFFETVVLSLFGFAQNQREEYMLLNLFKSAIHHELDSIHHIEEFLRGNPVFIKLAVHYNRGAKERKYLRELLAPIITDIVDDPEIDLQSNPLLIYRALIKQEESRTGERSSRPYDVTAEVALNDAETRTVLIKHLQQLRSITDRFIDRIYQSLPNMPYGIRYIAKELKVALTAKFPDQKEQVIIKIVGHLVYYRYINPAIVAPESFDVIDRDISPHHRRCLAEVAKMLNQVSMGKLFTEDNIFLQPLNTYVEYTSEKFGKYIYKVTEVEDPEDVFGCDAFLDLTQTRRPTIYISPNEIYALHQTLLDSLDLLVDSDEDPLAIILNELGNPPSVASDQSIASAKEISLHLVNRFPAISEQDSELKRLFVETKRLITYVLRVQSGPTLLDILKKPVTELEEQRFDELIRREELEMERRVNELGMSPKSNPNTNTNTESTSATGSSTSHHIMDEATLIEEDRLADIKDMTFAELKLHAFHQTQRLEHSGYLESGDCYQKLIQAIAADLRSRTKRRQRRNQELIRIQRTLTNLNAKLVYLEDQQQVYHDYLDACMDKLKGGSKKNKVIPFTKQYFHLKQLAKQGGVPQLGSYQLSAEKLYQQGVLISIDNFTPKQYSKLNIVLASHKLGVFKVEVFYLNKKLPSEDMDISLETLLQYQFDNIQVISLFDGDVKVNVNLLVWLINKKFFA